MEGKSIKKERPTWLTKHDKPVIIAGPCSAETEDQVLETARRINNLGKVDIFRAGIWKPRTRPDSFEGVGKVGLPWLQSVKKETGLQITVEVAKASHVELCLEAGIDILWIGARTTVNPFAVQDIADALAGVDIPILVKNPINPDLTLWLGAVERFQKVGLKKIGAIHRGFSNLGEIYYRNTPQWQIALEFKRMMPFIPLICDPSHICGRRDILFDVGQKAFDLNYDGLMIESHIDPDKAWSDANQQITPEVLGEMLSNFVLRKDFEDEAPVQNELQYLREKIDHIDNELINLLSDRMTIAREIGSFKKEHNMTILQLKRWNEIINRSMKKANNVRLSEAFILKLIRAIHDESIEQQSIVFRDDKSE